MYFRQVTTWNFLSRVPSNHPYLVFTEAAGCLDKVQLSLILVKDVLCDCLPVSEYIGTPMYTAPEIPMEQPVYKLPQLII